MATVTVSLAYRSADPCKIPSFLLLQRKAVGNGLYIAVLKEVDGDIFDGLCVAILKNVSDPELISFIGPGFKNNLASKVEHFRPNENITKIREFIMDRQCSTSIIIPGDSLPLAH